jgi:hypothetical protein
LPIVQNAISMAIILIHQQIAMLAIWQILTPQAILTTWRLASRQPATHAIQRVRDGHLQVLHIAGSRFTVESTNNQFGHHATIVIIILLIMPFSPVLIVINTTSQIQMGIMME